MSPFMMFEASGDSEADSSDNFYDPVSYRSLHGSTLYEMEDEDDAESCAGSSNGEVSDCYGDSVCAEHEVEDDEYEADDCQVITTVEEEHLEEWDDSADSENHRRLMSPARALESDKLFWEACLAS